MAQYLHHDLRIENNSRENTSMLLETSRDSRTTQGCASPVPRINIPEAGLDGAEHQTKCKEGSQPNRPGASTHGGGCAQVGSRSDARRQAGRRRDWGKVAQIVEGGDGESRPADRWKWKAAAVVVEIAGAGEDGVSGYRPVKTLRNARRAGPVHDQICLGGLIWKPNRAREARPRNCRKC